MLRLSTVLKRLKYALPIGLGFLWFYILERVAMPPRFILHVRLDDSIPFVPVFIIPYVVWYFYIALPAVVMLFKSPWEFKRYMAFLAGGMFVACAVYTLWPNGIDLRPDLAGETGPFSAAIRFLYSIDTPTNSAPSIHTTFSVGAHLAIIRYNQNRLNKPWIAPLSALVMVLIILSTVLVKQHSVVDLLAGLFLAIVLHVILYRKSKSLRSLAETAADLLPEDEKVHTHG